MTMVWNAVMPLLRWLPGFLGWLFQTSVMVSILVGLVLLLKWVLKDRLPIKWQYALWLIVLLRALLPWAPESSISMYNLFSLSEPSGRIDALITQVAEQRQPSPDAAEPAAEETLPNGVAEVGDEAAKTKTAAAPAEPADSSRQPAGLTPKDGAYAGLFGLWLAGVIALSVYLFRINRRFAKSIVFGSNGMVNPELEELLQSCQHKLGVRRKISLRMTDQGSGPALHGLRSPKILLPATIVDQFSANEIKYIFLHELVHHKRKDIAVNWVMTALLILHWFNPVLWYAYRKMREDQELSCDAQAVSYIGPDEAKQYGHTVIKLLETLSGKPSRLLAAAYFSKNRLEIKRRITMIALFKKTSFKRTALGLILVAVIVGIALTNAKGKVEGQSSPIVVPSEYSFEDWLWYDDYMTSQELGLVSKPDIRVEDKGYAFEIESVMVDNSRVVLTAKHFGPDGHFLQSPLEDGGIFIKDRDGKVVATLAGSPGGTRPNVEEYIFLFTETPPDQIVIQGKTDHIWDWADKKDDIKREKIEVNWKFEFTLDMTKAKRLGTSEALNANYTTPAGLQMEMKQFFRTPNGLRLDMDLDLNEKLAKQAIPEWRQDVELWYHLETDDPEAKAKYFGGQSGPFGGKIEEVYKANASTSWSRTWLTSMVSPELKNIRFVLDGYSLPIKKEASVEIDLNQLAKKPVVFEDEGDKITLEKYGFETDPDTEKRNLRLSGSGIYINQQNRDKWIAMDANETTYSVIREGIGRINEDGGSVWDELDFIVNDVPNDISKLTLKRIVVDKVFTDVNWSVDLPSYTTLPWKNK
ncbi:MAG: M56 family metallopeptidase [Paenibacillus macerans]|uniref:M56 family metallopeptidase n=1 Tax=Paenibacillus macerans TaxID=44252 RepID=UPI0029155542|nr:M56 family metallopeptidase [Paenibacillus macerans]MDU7477437.1 M56 family metallopeptidase [Paenibacillus macerans]